MKPRPPVQPDTAAGNRPPTLAPLEPLTVNYAAAAAALDPAKIADMREWLVECFESQEDEILEAPPSIIVANVQRHWDGGLAGFLATYDR